MGYIIGDSIPTLKGIMHSDIVAISPDDSVKTAIDTMATNNIGCVVSVEMDKPVGILTERDVVRLCSKGTDFLNTKVRDVMTKNIISMDSSKSVQEAVGLLQQKHIKKIPIIENGKLIGIITMTDLLKSMEEIEKQESERLRNVIKDLNSTNIKLRTKIIDLEKKLP